MKITVVLTLLLVLLYVTETLARHMLSLPEYSLQSSMWNLQGSAFRNHNQLQLSNTAKNSIGAISHSVPFSFPVFEIKVAFQVTGDDLLSGDGFGLFLSHSPIVMAKDQPFGVKPEGLAVIFDSSDNDMLGNNPAVAAHLFQGELKKYSKEDDGISHQLSGCIANFRNRKHPIIAKITLENQHLSVYLDLKGRNTFQKCLTVPDVGIEGPLFVSVAASNHEASDIHIVEDFQLLIPPEYAAGRQGTDIDEHDLVRDSLEKLSPLMHGKLDQLLSEQVVKSSELGEALGEIEENVVSHIQGLTEIIMEVVQHMNSEAGEVREEIANLKNGAKGHQSVIESIKSTIEKKPTEEDLQNRYMRRLCQEAERKLQYFIKTYFSNMERELDEDTGGSFMQTLVMVVLCIQSAIVMIVTFNTLRRRNSSKYHML